MYSCSSRNSCLNGLHSPTKKFTLGRLYFVQYLSNYKFVYPDIFNSCNSTLYLFEYAKIIIFTLTGFVKDATKNYDIFYGWVPPHRLPDS